MASNLRGVEIALDIGNDVHHLAVEFEDELVGDLDAADPRHPADIVAAEIEQHQVFGALLLVLEQFLGKRFVLSRRGTAASRAGNGSDGDLAITDPDQNFW